MTVIATTIKQVSPNPEVVEVLLETADSPTLTGGTDTVTLTLSAVGIQYPLMYEEFVHTTDNSVIVAASCTGAVSSGVLTLTTSSGNNNKKRVFRVTGKSTVSV